jgi:SagB-type dehydrogenase family enzyme
MSSPSREELDRTSFVEFHARIMAHDEEAPTYHPRTYPGYPRWPLARPRRRLWPALDLVLSRRRCQRTLSTVLPAARVLGRLLWLAHGSHLSDHRGPVPSAGSLQALELYLVTLADGWLPSGQYHYDRPGHHLSGIVEGAGREEWQGRVPSLGQVEGGALLWVCVGDADRTHGKYGGRGERFLLLEAGHLMQNLCLVSASLGLTTVPLGGYLERDIAHAFRLPPGDRVLYLGLCGRPTR